MSLGRQHKRGFFERTKIPTASPVRAQTAMERLSSGKKITSAADDAAGFAIAERMTAQIRGSTWLKNVNDGCLQ